MTTEQAHPRIHANAACTGINACAENIDKATLTYTPQADVAHLISMRRECNKPLVINGAANISGAADAEPFMEAHLVSACAELASRGVVESVATHVGLGSCAAGDGATAVYYDHVFSNAGSGASAVRVPLCVIGATCTTLFFRWETGAVAQDHAIAALQFIFRKPSLFPAIILKEYPTAFMPMYDCVLKTIMNMSCRNRAPSPSPLMIAVSAAIPGAGGPPINIQPATPRPREKSPTRQSASDRGSSRSTASPATASCNWADFMLMGVNANEKRGAVASLLVIDTNHNTDVIDLSTVIVPGRDWVCIPRGARTKHAAMFSSRGTTPSNSQRSAQQM